MTFEEVQLVKQLIGQMDKGLQQSIADKEIGEHIHQKFREAVSKRSSTSNDRKRLTKARVITTEEVIRLRYAREAADAEKEAKRIVREGKKVAKRVILPVGTPTPVTPKPKRGRAGRKTVHISNAITVLGVGLGAGGLRVVRGESDIEEDGELGWEPLADDYKSNSDDYLPSKWQAPAGTGEERL